MITRVTGRVDKQKKISDQFYINLLDTVNANINRYGYKRNEYIKSSYKIRPTVCNISAPNTDAGVPAGQQANMATDTSVPNDNVGR